MPKHSWQTSPEWGQRLKPLAREMRREPTGAEAKLWQHLRKRQVRGVRFRRQHIIERFIPDFCALDVMLIVEVDGPIHQYTQEEDRVRQAFLESLGYEVLRFANMEVFTNVRAVLDVIEAAVERRKPLPGPPQGEGAVTG
ncbi:MAG: endonuclease domain-containing protein [Caldilineaceae bacterium]|nr:endonuclease domain-containing protein [Caldilineaceae bacterium]